MFNAILDLLTTKVSGWKINELARVSPPPNPCFNFPFFCLGNWAQSWWMTGTNNESSSAWFEKVFSWFSFSYSDHFEIYYLEVRVDSLINSDIRTQGRRLADGGLSSSGDIGTDREDSPLQSKRSSTFEFVHILIATASVVWLVVAKCLTASQPTSSITHSTSSKMFLNKFRLNKSLIMQSSHTQVIQSSFCLLHSLHVKRCCT